MAKKRFVGGVEELKKGFRSRRIIAFVGAGVSRMPPALVPGWRACFETLCTHAKDFGKTEAADRALKVAKQTDFDPRYLTVAFDDLRQALGGDVYHRTMQDILKPRSIDKFPEAVNLLVELPFWAYITTNVDTLLERASERVAKEGRRESALRYFSDANAINYEVGQQRAGWLWKIHGTIEQPNTWIFTAEEYWRSIYDIKYGAHRELFRNLALQAQFVFVGFGGSDPDIDRHLDHLAQVFGGQHNRHVLLARVVSPEKRHQLSQRNIDVLEYGGPETHSSLITVLRDLLPRPPGKPAKPGLPNLAPLRDWMRSQTATIDFRRIAPRRSTESVARPVRVDEVFVPLHARPRPGHSDHRFRLSGSGGRTNLSQSLLSSTARAIAIVGEAGSGKTTLLKHVAQVLMADADRPIPLYLRLSDLAPVLREARAENKGRKLDPSGLLRVVDQVLKSYGLKLPTLETWLRSRDCVWFLDDLDEVQYPKEQQKLLEGLEQAARIWQRSRFIVAGRPHSLRPLSFPADFEVFYIDSLGDPEIRELVRNWVPVLFPEIPDSERPNHVSQFFDSVKADVSLSQLSRSPVMLTCMVLVHFGSPQHRLPNAKVDVLEAAIEWLLSAREHSSESGEVPIETVKECYTHLALELLGIGLKSGRHVGLRHAAELVEPHFESQVQSRHFIEREVDIGLIVRRGKGDVVFAVPLFQEYLAATNLAQRDADGPTGWWNRIREHLRDPEWREVLSLLPACLARYGSEGSDAFFEKVAVKARKRPFSEQTRYFGTAGASIPALRAVGGDAPTTGNWATLKGNMAKVFSPENSIVPLMDLVEAATVVGLLGDDRFQDPESLWVEISAGRALLGAQAEEPKREGFDPLALPWEGPPKQWDTPTFQVRRYPITVLEFGKFVKEGGYRSREFWPAQSWEFLTEHRIDMPGHWFEQEQTPNAPVTEVSWFEASAYCRWLANAVDCGHVVRLPSSNEWEYVARRSSLSRQRSQWKLVDRDGVPIANWSGAGLWCKTPAGLFPRSNTDDGVIDMYGNVEEWCTDEWPHGLLDSEQEKRFGVLAPYGFRIVRGGSSIRVSRLCRSSYLSRCRADGRFPTIGFRPVRMLGAEPAGS